MKQEEPEFIGIWKYEAHYETLFVIMHFSITRYWDSSRMQVFCCS